MSHLMLRCEHCKQLVLAAEIRQPVTAETCIVVDVDLEDLSDHECPDEDFVAPHCDPATLDARIAQEPQKPDP